MVFSSSLVSYGVGASGNAISLMDTGAIPLMDTGAIPFYLGLRRQLNIADCKLSLDLPMVEHI